MARGFDIGTTFDPAWDELLHANSGEDEPEDFPSLAALTMLSHPDVRQIIGDQWPRLLDELESMVVDVRDMFRAQAVEADLTSVFPRTCACRSHARARCRVSPALPRGRACWRSGRLRLQIL